MSRIGKQPIPVPAGVTVTIEGNKITTKGPKGELSYEFNPMMSIAQEGEELIVSRPDDSREPRHSTALPVRSSTTWSLASTRATRRSSSSLALATVLL